MKTSRRSLSAALLASLVITGIAGAKSRRRKLPATSDFSYYMLVLSDVPDYCHQARGNKDPRECGAGRRVGFVVHGLWPQGETSRGPEFCGPASPVSQAIIQATLRYIPTESLIQHEWAAHGTCSGLTAADYFAALRKARDSITVPADLNQPGADRSESRGGESRFPQDCLPDVLLSGWRTRRSPHLPQQGSVAARLRSQRRRVFRRRGNAAAGALRDGFRRDRRARRRAIRDRTCARNCD